jgi:hypothetical protein
MSVIKRAQFSRELSSLRGRWKTMLCKSKGNLISLFKSISVHLIITSELL